MSKTKASLEKINGIKYRMILEGLGVGLLTGLAVALFRLIIMRGEAYRNYLLKAIENSHGDFKLLAVALGLFFLCFIIVAICTVKVPLSKGSGIPQVKADIKGFISHPWLKVLVSKIVGSSAAISAGLSLGREGPSIQVGAMIGRGIASLRNKLPVEEKMIITCGAGAGLAGAFAAPLAGVIFVLEELHKNFSTEILMSTMAATVMSNFVTSYVFGLEPVFDLPITEAIPLQYYWMVLVLGVFLGLFGAVYNSLMMNIPKIYKKFKNPLLPIAFAFGLTLILAFTVPEVLGSSHHLVGEMAHLEVLSNTSIPYLLGTLALLLTIKLLFSVFSFCCGSPGGIFLPLLVLGAIAGALIGLLLFAQSSTPDQYINSFVILGMTGMFAAIVRAPITGVILITEMAGDFSNFLSLTLVALTASVVADLLGSKPIYDFLLENLEVEKKGIKKAVDAKMIFEADVYIGSYIDEKKIKDLIFPHGALVISIVRGDKEIVPNGDTKLEGGDRLILLCNESKSRDISETVDKMCKKIEG